VSTPTLEFITREELKIMASTELNMKYEARHSWLLISIIHHHDPFSLLRMVNMINDKVKIRIRVFSAHFNKMLLEAAWAGIPIKFVVRSDVIRRRVVINPVPMK
jgi:hypothetical protein